MDGVQVALATRSGVQTELGTGEERDRAYSKAMGALVCSIRGLPSRMILSAA